mgnify:FL=1
MLFQLVETGLANLLESTDQQVAAKVTGRKKGDKRQGQEEVGVGEVGALRIQTQSALVRENTRG